MSAIVGLFRFDGQHITARTLQPAMDALAHYGGDGNGLWTDRVVGLGCQMLRITPESSTEILPHTRHGLTISADARIDNRDELFDLLSVPASLRADLPDSELILRAYERWQQECPRYLIGEFAFAIWDERARQLFCAVDHIGVRPLYYHHSQKMFAFATDVRALWTFPDVPVGLDESEVAFYLACEHRSKTRTLYQGVSKLVFGRQLSVSERGLQTKSYWFPFELSPIRLSSEEDYAHRLRELIEESVACRIRTNVPVAAHVSGGLDSSTIAVLAQRQLNERGRALEMAYSWSPPESTNRSTAGERSRIGQIADPEKIRVHFVRVPQDRWHSRFRRFPIMGDIVDYEAEREALKHASKLCVRVMLTGMGGDQGITIRGKGYLPELWRSGRWIRLAREIAGFGKTWKGAALNSFLTAFPFLDWRQFDSQPRTDFLHPELATKYVPEIRAIEPFSIKAGLRRQQKFRIEYGDIPIRLAEWLVLGAEFGVVYAYPMLDRRVMEFAYRIPSNLFLRRGLGAFIYRMAVQDVLPPHILWNSWKWDEAYSQEIRKQYQDLRVRLPMEVRNGNWDNLDNPYLDLSTLRNQISRENLRLSCSLFAAIDIRYLWERVSSGVRAHTRNVCHASGDAER